MQHINLIDYIDRPESIRHVIDSFPDVVKIEHLPENLKMNKMKVTFRDGSHCYYYEDGTFLRRDDASSFVLKEDGVIADELHQAVDKVLAHAKKVLSTEAYNELYSLKHKLNG